MLCCCAVPTRTRGHTEHHPLSTIPGWSVSFDRTTIESSSTTTGKRTRGLPRYLDIQTCIAASEILVTFDHTATVGQIGQETRR